jgi:hypothetical protein
MTQRTGRVGAAIEDAAAELGLSPAALKVHMLDRGLEGVSPDLFQSVTTELKARANSLRLDDLGKFALTVDWLAEHALVACEAEALELLKAEVETLRVSLESERRSEAVEALELRIVGLEAQLGKADEGESAKTALQVAANLQSLVESQGREIDQLRSELAQSHRETAELAKAFRAFTNALRSAIPDDPVHEGSAGKAHARGSETAAKAGTSHGPAHDQLSSSKASVVNSTTSSQPELEPTPEPANSRFENSPVANALRYGIRREIEYNFLLERMGYRRLDSYSNEELSGGENVNVPTDGEIQIFLAKYEVGGNPEEVEIVTVHRGEFQMVQYQRVEKAGGLRGWMPKQRK